MKKLVVVVVAFLSVVSFLAGCSTESANMPSHSQSISSDEPVVIGISQFVEAPALDAAKEGFISGLEEAGYVEGENLLLKFENSQADFPTTQTIAQSFVAQNVDLILAIATPSAQSAANATQEIPILITAVTDPVAAELVMSLDKPETNVTGTSDMNPIEEQLKLLKRILPAVKNVGVIYNAAEVNSQVQVDIAREVVTNLNITLVETTVANSSEISQAVQTLAGKVDAVYLVTDNTVVSAIGAIIKACNDTGIPIIGSEGAHVEAGALATVGIDYFTLGKQTAEMAVEIFNGEQPQEIPIEISREFRLTINTAAADLLGIKLPETIINEADSIID